MIIYIDWDKNLSVEEIEEMVKERMKEFLEMEISLMVSIHSISWRYSANHRVHLKIVVSYPCEQWEQWFYYFSLNLMLRKVFHDDSKRLLNDIGRMAYYMDTDRVDRVSDVKVVRGKIKRAGEWHSLDMDVIK